MEMVRMEGVSFRYPDTDQKALQNICFSIGESELFLLCGLTGSGKSTLLKLLKPGITPHGVQEGAIDFAGRPLEEYTAKETAQLIGFVDQDPENQIVMDTVWHELAFPLENLGYPRDVMHRKVAEMASFFGIEKWFHKNTFSLSGGEKQIVNLASSMICEPQLLLLDEPISQLDPIAAERFLHMLQKVREEFGTTVLICEHHFEEVLGYADQVGYIEEGRMPFTGAPKKAAEEWIKKESPIYEGLPPSVKIAAALGAKEMPMNLREGRAFLRSRIEASARLPEPPHPPAGETIIQAKHCFFRYEKGEKDAVRDSSIDIEKGKITGILGGNGAGKTTFLRLLCGKYKPYRGKVKISGNPIVRLLPQDPKALFTKRRVCEEVDEEGLRFLHLIREKEKHPYDLSGGQQQSLALGILLQDHLDILFLDEPTKGMDPSLKRRLGEWLITFAKEGKTLVLVSHDIAFCARYCDTNAMMFDGAVVSQEEKYRFFSENRFYTTKVARMTHGILENAILEEDVIDYVHRNHKD